MDNIMMDGMSFDMEQEARDRLRSVFPDCFSDGKLDIDKLLSLCGEEIQVRVEGQDRVPAPGSQALHRHPAPLPRGERELL